MKKILTGLLICVLIACGIYASCTYLQYNNKFMRGTSINGVDVSLKTIDEALSLLNKTQTTVSIKENDVNYELNLNDFAKITYNEEDVKYVFECANKNKFIFSINKNYTINPNVDIDNEKIISEIISKTDRTESKDAFITMKDNLFIIEKEVNGNEINKEKTIELLNNSIKNNDLDIEFTNDCYLQANKTESSLQEQCDNFNKCLNIKIDISCRSDKTEIIDKDIIATWLIKENDFYKVDKNNLVFDELKIEEFVANIDDKYSTYGNSEKFVTHSGDEIELSTSFYGWQVDSEALKEEILKSLNDKKDVSFELPYKQKAVEAENNIGNTYLEISIENQHWWYYKDGEVALESDCVTGMYSSPSRRTETGLTYVLNKVQDTMLRGATWNTHVDYWIGINYDGEGVHDASWRSSFGGKIYINDGSHGCVNTPLSKVAALYDQIEVGTPVIVY